MRVFVFRTALLACAVLAPLSVRGDDQTIVKNIREQITQQKNAGTLRGFGVKVQVNQGVVFLDGHVSSAEQEKRVLEIARRISGVNQVVTDLEVKPTTATPAQPATNNQVKPSGGNFVPPLPGATKTAATQPKIRRTPLVTPSPVKTEQVKKPTSSNATSHPPLYVDRTEVPKAKVAKSTPATVTKPAVAKKSSNASQAQIAQYNEPVESALKPVQVSPLTADNSKPPTPLSTPKPPSRIAQVSNPTPQVAQPQVQPLVQPRSVQTQQPASVRPQQPQMTQAQLYAWQQQLMSQQQQMMQRQQILQQQRQMAYASQARLSAANQQQGPRPSVGPQQSFAQRPMTAQRPTMGQMAMAPLAPIALATGQFNNRGGVRQAQAVVAQPGAVGVNGSAPIPGGTMPVPGGAMPAPGQYYMPPSGGQGPPPQYDHPQMPGYAYPAYAARANYGQVNYPKQYSPTAWPYIGPFYPYPQVPLGWRKVTLEWDDGWWMLDFKDR